MGSTAVSTVELMQQGKIATVGVGAEDDALVVFAAAFRGAV